MALSVITVVWLTPQTDVGLISVGLSVSALLLRSSVIPLVSSKLTIGWSGNSKPDQGASLVIGRNVKSLLARKYILLSRLTLTHCIPLKQTNSSLILVLTCWRGTQPKNSGKICILLFTVPICGSRRRCEQMNLSQSQPKVN